MVAKKKAPTKKKGFTYGAKEEKRIKVFMKKYGVQRGDAIRALTSRLSNTAPTKKKASVKSKVKKFVKDALKGPGARSKAKGSYLKSAVSTAKKKQTAKINKSMAKTKAKSKKK